MPHGARRNEPGKMFEEEVALGQIHTEVGICGKITVVVDLHVRMSIQKVRTSEQATYKTIVPTIRIDFIQA